MAAQPDHAEIARVEEELKKLRAQYANLKRSARYFLPFCAVVGVLVLAFLVYSMVIESTAAIITAAAILIVLIGLAVASRHERFLIFLSSPDGVPYPQTSHAEFLQSAIAQREKRLADLKAKG